MSDTCGEWPKHGTGSMLRMGKLGGIIRCRSCEVETWMSMMKRFRRQDNGNCSSEEHGKIEMDKSRRCKLFSYMSCYG